VVNLVLSAQGHRLIGRAFRFYYWGERNETK
jgi:hypothetical protein